jgi:hypothetical protein
VSLIDLLDHLEHLFLRKASIFYVPLDSTAFLYSNSKNKVIETPWTFALQLSFPFGDHILFSCSSITYSSCSHSYKLHYFYKHMSLIHQNPLSGPRCSFRLLMRFHGERLSSHISSEAAVGLENHLLREI